MSEIVADNISIIQSDELEGVTGIVAEYYQPKYLSLTESLKRKSLTLCLFLQKLRNFIVNSPDSHGRHANPSFEK